MRRGYTLIEQMIVVGILAIVASGLWTVRGLLSAPGTPGNRGLQRDRAAIALAAAQQESLLTPLAAEAGQSPRLIESQTPHLRIVRAVKWARPGLLEVTLYAGWPERKTRQRMRLVTFKAEQP